MTPSQVVSQGVAQQAGDVDWRAPQRSWVGLSRHNADLGITKMAEDKITVRASLEKGSDTGFLLDLTTESSEEG